MGIEFDDQSTGVSYEKYPKDPEAREQIAIVKNKVEELEDNIVSKQEIVKVTSDITSLNVKVDDKASVQSVTTLTSQLAETVKEVNGAKPVNGKIIIPIPEVDTSTLVKKGEVKSSDFSTGSDGDKIKLVNLSDEVQRALTGNAPALSVVPNRSVTVEKLGFAKVGKNLLDKNRVTAQRKLIHLGTTIETNADYHLSDYIEVEVGETYTCTYMYGYAYFGSEFNPISGHAPAGLGTTNSITIPTGVKYIRLNIYRTRIDMMQFEKGAVATPYENYYSYIGSDYVETKNNSIRAIKLNKDAAKIFDYDESPLKYGAARLKIFEIEYGAISASTGENQEVKTRVRSKGFIYNTKPNTVILLNKSYRVVAIMYNANNTISETGWRNENIIIPDTIVKYRVFLSRNDNAELSLAELDNIDSIIKIAEGTNDLLTSNTNLKNNSFLLFGNKKKYISIAGIVGQGMSNCKEAIVQSAHAGMDGVEVDVRLSKDNNVILAHNEDISTFVNAPSGTKVSEKTTAELKEYIHTAEYISYSYYEPIKLITLSECIDVCKKYGLLLMIDMKSDGYESDKQQLFADKIIDICIEKGIQDYCSFVSLQQTTRVYIRSKLPNAHIALKKTIWNTTFEQDISQVKEIGGNVIMQVEAKDGTAIETPSILTPERIKKYHENDLPVKDIDWEITNDLKGVRKSGIHYTFIFTTSDNGMTYVMNTKFSSEEGILTPTTLTKKSDHFLFKCTTLFPLLLSCVRPSINVRSNNPTIHFNCLIDGGIKIYPSGDINTISLTELTLTLDF